MDHLIEVANRLTDTRGCYNCVHCVSSGCSLGLNPALKDAPSGTQGLATRKVVGSFSPDDMAVFCDQYLWGPFEMPTLQARLKVRLKTEPATDTSHLASVRHFAPFCATNAGQSSRRIAVAMGAEDPPIRYGIVRLTMGPEVRFILAFRENGITGRMLEPAHKIISVHWNGKYRRMSIAEPHKALSQEAG